MLVKVLWTCIDDDGKEAEKLLTHLPESLTKEIADYEGEFHKKIKIHARLLLLELLKMFGEHYTPVQHTIWGKPFLSNSISFNISHSGNIAVVAGGYADTLGIDIEQHRKIELTELTGCFLAAEVHRIQNSPASHNLLIDYWSAKEAVMKADGRGLALSMDQVAVSSEFDKAVVESSKLYHLRAMTLMEGYSCFLALPLAHQFADVAVHYVPYSFLDKVETTK